jgi:predicted metalloendopeptidase
MLIAGARSAPAILHHKNPHPPAEYRTNSTLANTPAFQAAFTVVPPSPMVKAPRCVIW